jgi:hypothetical protein
MDCIEFVSFVKTWFFNLFNCIKDFNNNSLEELFVPLDDDKEVEIVLPESDFKPITPEEIDEYADIPELLPIEKLPSVDNEEYGFEQELENIDTSSDDDYDYQYYYRE